MLLEIAFDEGQSLVAVVYSLWVSGNVLFCHHRSWWAITRPRFEEKTREGNRTGVITSA